MDIGKLKYELSKYFGISKTRKTFYTDVVIMVLIVLTSLTFVIETYPIPNWLSQSMKILDTLILMLFTLEFGVRYWVAKNKKRFFKNMYTIIDFLVILPFIVGQAHLQFFRILRVFRILRYLEKYFSFSDNKYDKHIETILFGRIAFVLFALLFISAGLFYTAEVATNDNISTYDDALYFTISTVTTVGFGDIVPVTKLGEVITMLMILCGVLLIPYHLGLIIKYAVLKGKRKRQTTCKSCGLKYHDPDATYCKSCGSLVYQEYEGAN